MQRVTTGFERVADMQAYLDAHKDDGITQAAVAKQIGVNPASFSKWLKGEKHGDVETLAAKVEDFLNRETRRAEIVMVTDLLMTSHAQSINTLLARTFMNREIRILRSASGLGKTTTCSAFCKANPNTFLVTADSISGDPTALVAALYQALFHGAMPGRRRDGLREILEYLRGRDCLLIIDEAHYLYAQTLDLARRIHDEAHVAMVFTETSDMQDVPGALREKQYLKNPQLRNRTGRAWMLPTEILREDIRLFAEPLGVRSAEAINWLYGHINNPFARYRELVRVLRDAQRLVQANGGTIDDMNHPELLHIAADEYCGQ